MFSTTEFDYLKCIVNTYISQGYKYYVAHTITETNNVYDFCIYFSKDEIVATTDNSFVIPDGSIVVFLDSSSRNDNQYNPSTHSRTSLQYFHGTLNVNIAEFIFTNATTSYTLTTNVVNPDLLYNSKTFNSYVLDYCLLFILCVTFIYTFCKSILRIRR